ncbi:MAG: 23S rRNA (guanosine(2251)-2'-O)-methyltransferase RlmB, partial [Propionibacteriaceae bacterium]|nr:23S rRNA (guanosine(2251)-2'-O)-methyltransferase RlmB [Propionibacteriaceae bacterium]
DFEYADVLDVIDAAVATDGIIVACDHVTDPHNLGAIIRSAAAFGACGVVIPSRRAAKMTASAWKASAGAAARLPVAQVINLNRALEQFTDAGCTVVGLAGDGDVTIDNVHQDGPLALIVGSEGTGLSRLVAEHCDTLARISIAESVESLNASVATSIALYELTRQS